jgi:hypothetical protein
MGPGDGPTTFGSKAGPLSARYPSEPASQRASQTVSAAAEWSD